MIALALEGVTASSTMPLRHITLLGSLVSLFSSLLGRALDSAAFFKNVVPGWASTVIPIYSLCGAQMICLGVRESISADILSVAPGASSKRRWGKKAVSVADAFRGLAC